MASGARASRLEHTKSIPMRAYLRARARVGFKGACRLQGDLMELKRGRVERFIKQVDS
jgi:hypothetical protein